MLDRQFSIPPDALPRILAPSLRTALRKAGLKPQRFHSSRSALVAPSGSFAAALLMAIVAFSVAPDHAGLSTNHEAIGNPVKAAAFAAPSKLASREPMVARFTPKRSARHLDIEPMIARGPGSEAQSSAELGLEDAWKAASRPGPKIVDVGDQPHWTSGIVLPDDKIALMEELRPEAEDDIAANELGTDEPEDLALIFDEAPVDVSDEIVCLAQNVYFEARGEPNRGRVGVAFVVMNRVASKKFPSSVCSVVRQGGEERLHRCQFSWWCDGKSDAPKNFPLWLESLKVAGEVYWGRAKDPTAGALWYHADYVAPGWSKYLDRGPTIGRHIFYGPATDKSKRPQLAESNAVN